MFGVLYVLSVLRILSTCLLCCVVSFVGFVIYVFGVLVVVGDFCFVCTRLCVYMCVASIRRPLVFVCVLGALGVRFAKFFGHLAVLHRSNPFLQMRSQPCNQLSKSVHNATRRTSAQPAAQLTVNRRRAFR